MLPTRKGTFSPSTAFLLSSSLHEQVTLHDQVILDEQVTLHEQVILDKQVTLDEQVIPLHRQIILFASIE